jgi:preprotein translocase subunit SecA
VSLLTVVKNLFDSNAKEVKKLEKIVKVINSHEESMQRLSAEALRDKTAEFKRRVKEEKDLDDILPEAFAAVRETAKRVLGMRHYDVQMIGGIVLHQGRIAEMRTGEGKTLMATTPTYLNALMGKGVHVVTVNDYLAKRDARWMGPVYHALGMTVGIIQHDTAYLFDPEWKVEDESLDFLRPVPRAEAYRADITYGTNNEFGFDYLRDNMVMSAEQCVQRELWFAIVDEVDSILIDEARTPLIISGMGRKSTDLYAKFAKIVEKLKPEEDYEVDEKAHSVPLTEEGVSHLEDILGIKKPASLYDDDNIELVHHANQALRAKELYKLDDEYVIKDGEIVIVDEFTGRLMFGRRYSDGLHQAIEAKEGVKVRQEDQTLATITFQNYFRLYHKLGGMTGTAATEEREFREIYALDVVVIPTNRPMIRKDMSDLVYKNQQAKINAVIEDIEDCHKRGQPTLVGTRSIEKSEELSKLLKKKGIPHNVLNAKHHEREAQIIAQAGHKGAVTIATNMAGRGVDIILGGNPPTPEEAAQVKEAGGLHIIGTERHESRRIDNQLRGRSGRQGDPGSSRFYVSLDDELMRLFGSDRISGWMDRLGVEEDVPIEHSLITRGIENAQSKVESRHYDMRKSVLEYDDVMNKQREIIYGQRRRILEGENLKPHVLEMIDTIVKDIVDLHAGEEMHPEEWDLDGIIAACRELFVLPDEATVEALDGLGRQALLEEVEEWAEAAYVKREEELGEPLMRQLERVGLLHVIDDKWIDHLSSMDMLREGIGLRAYGQKDPRIEYINEAFEAFEGLKKRIQEDTIRFLYRVRVHDETGEDIAKKQAKDRPVVTRTNRDDDGQGTTVRKPDKVGRNDLCPCGSGKKYKRCHGMTA